MWLNRLVPRVPAGDHAPLAGSYNSALFTAIPPTTSTRPSLRTVPVWPLRGVFMPLVGFHFPVAVSKISADLMAALGSIGWPPAMRTGPFANGVALWAPRASAMLPALDHEPDSGGVVPVVDDLDEPPPQAGSATRTAPASRHATRRPDRGPAGRLAACHPRWSRHSGSSWRRN